jgi:hypothetical protein
MQGSEILAPFIGMMVLTLVVWTVMYVRRIGYLKANRIAPQRLTTSERFVELVPEEVSYPANNLRNLFELPVIFYALCLYLYVSASVDMIYVVAAWIFLASRILHSAIQCTVNIVMRRFQAYLAGALVLWFMVLRAAVQLLQL